MDKKKTILLVEDEIIIALGEKVSLEKYGYSVVTANSGEKAIDFIRANPIIDLILMDIDLGIGIDGTETASIILKEHNIPIVFLSSHTEPEIVEKTEKITSYGYVVKNTGITVLNASIKMAFRLFEANRKIFENEIKQKSMIANISDVIGILGIDGTVKYISPNVNRWFGWDADDLIGNNGWAVVSSDDLKRLTIELLSLIEKDNFIKKVQYSFKCKDGSYKPVEMAITNLMNDPIINGILVNFNDISEHKEIEDELSMTNELFSQFISKSPICCYIKDVTPNQSFVLKASDNIEEITGIPVTDTICKPMDFIFPKVIADKITKDDYSVISSGKLTKTKEKINGKDYLIIKYPICFGDKTLLAEYAININDLKQYLFSPI